MQQGKLKKNPFDFLVASSLTSSSQTGPPALPTGRLRTEGDGAQFWVQAGLSILSLEWGLSTEDISGPSHS